MTAAFPAADLFALTHDRSVPFDLGGRTPTTTFLDRIPALRGRRQLQLPLMPLAWRYASSQRYDVVVTSSHACVKGFRPGRHSLHLSYCYTPMRYVWLPDVDRRHRPSRISRVPAALFRRWDRHAAAWVDEFAAISSAVQLRIERFYGRSSRVIHPPVDTDFYSPAPDVARQDFVLAVSRMVPYKRLDLAILACHHGRLPLVVAGAGPEEAGLRQLAHELGAEVTFVIAPSDDRLRELYRTARAVVFPGVEDFGIVVVEAQACGTPVVALGRAGALDTVRPGSTGVLVPEQEPVAFADGLAQVLEAPPDPCACRASAERFSRWRFMSRFRDWVETAAKERGIDARQPAHR